MVKVQAHIPPFIKLDVKYLIPHIIYNSENRFLEITVLTCMKGIYKGHET